MLWTIVGVTRLHRLPLPVVGPTTWAVIIQGNISEAEHNANLGSYDFAQASFNAHLALTRQGMARVQAEAKDHPVLVVWPETASPFPLSRDQGARQTIALAASGAAASLVGTVRDSGTGATAQYYNGLVAVLPDGSVGGAYDKHHLVPYGEYFPSYLPIRLGEQDFRRGPAWLPASARLAAGRTANLLRGNLPGRRGPRG